MLYTVSAMEESKVEQSNGDREFRIDEPTFRASLPNRFEGAEC
jgi:hypothetical protein